MQPEDYDKSYVHGCLSGISYCKLVYQARVGNFGVFRLHVRQ